MFAKHNTNNFMFYQIETIIRGIESLERCLNKWILWPKQWFEQKNQAAVYKMGVG